MKKGFLALSTIFFLSLLAVAQNANVAVSSRNANVATSATPEPPKTKIVGRVVYEDTGKPVRRGSIQFLKLSERSFNDIKMQILEKYYSSNAITNDDGEFVIDAIGVGEYYPRIEVAGVLNPEAFESYDTTESALKIEKINQLFEKIIVLESVKEQQILIRAKRGSAISGKIAYADGEPAIGVDVESLRISEYGFEISSKTTTDDRGIYRFAGIMQDTYIIRVVEPTVRNTERYYGSNSSSISELKVYYGNTKKISEARTVELARGEEKSEINIVIPDRKTYTISGRVIAKSSKVPIKNARVSFENSEEELALSYKSRTSNSKTAETNETGDFIISDLPEGNYVFKISPPSESAYNSVQEEKQTKAKPKFAEIRKEIVIADTDLENVLLEMPIAAKLSGTLLFEDKRDVKDVYFMIFDDDKELSSSQSSNSYISEDSGKAKKPKNFQWDFELSDISEGNYFPYAGQSGEDEDFYVKSISIGDKEWLSSPLEIKENDEIRNVKIILATDVGTINGKVETGNQNSLRNLRAILIPVKNPNARALIKYSNVSESGVFSTKLAPGEYFLAIMPLAEIRQYRKLKHENWVEKIRNNAETITIKPNAMTTISLKK